MAWELKFVSILFVVWSEEKRFNVRELNLQGFGTHEGLSQFAQLSKQSNAKIEPNDWKDE